MNSRVITLDGAGAGTIGVPPCRYTGTPDATDITTITNLGRALTQDLLVLATYQLCSGDIVIIGTPGADIHLFFDMS